jgi:hypothetical protein
MVDGVATGQQLVDTTSALGNSAAFFSLLVDEGFVAAVSSPAKTPSALVQSAPRKELVRSVCIMVSDLLGPNGDSLTLKLEKARSNEEFARQVEVCRDVISDMVGKKKGEQFWNAVLEKLSA